MTSTDRTGERLGSRPAKSAESASPESRDTVGFFDSIADGYRELYDERTPGGYAFTVRRRRVLELFDADGGEVLDVGCGPGIMVDALTERGCTFWGVDPSARMIEAGSKAFSSRPGVHFAVGLAERLEFPDETFDAVLCMGVLERVRDDEAALEEMVRVLKPGGTLIVTLPNKRSPVLLWRDYVFYPLVALLRPLYRSLARAEARKVIPGHRLYSPRSYAASVARRGCTVTDVVHCGYSIFLAPLDSLFPRLATAFSKRSERLHRGPLRGLGAAFIVKARKRSSVDD